MRFLAHVSEDGLITPQFRERVTRWRGKDVWISVHAQPTIGVRSSDSNRFLWGVVYRAICEETGNDPESVHWGLKREAVRVGVLDPEYIVLGDQLIEGEPTTVVDSDTFSRYVAWVVDWAREKIGVHVEDSQ
jgi:hypothetical protein